MRAAGALLALVVGVAAAIGTVVLHQLWWGLLLGASATVTTLVALRPGWTTRLPYAVGWVALVAYVVLPRSDGGFAVSADSHGYALLALAVVVGVAGVTTLPRPGRGAGQRRSAHLG